MGNYSFCIGVDHGSQPNAQVAILAAVEMSDPQNPWVYVLDEYVSGSLLRKLMLERYWRCSLETPSRLLAVDGPETISIMEAPEVER